MLCKMKKPLKIIFNNKKFKNNKTYHQNEVKSKNSKNLNYCKDNKFNYDIKSYNLIINAKYILLYKIY